MNTDIKCLACNEKATIKDYRTHNGIVDGYPVCKNHQTMDDLNFWKQVKIKSIKEYKTCNYYL